MPDPRIYAGKRANKSAILARVQIGDSADEMKGRGSYSQAGTGGLGMAGERVSEVGIEPVRDVVQQFDKLGFQSIVNVEVDRNERCLQRVQHDTPAHNIRSGSDRTAIALDPIRWHHGIGIGRQKNSISS